MTIQDHDPELEQLLREEEEIERRLAPARAFELEPAWPDHAPDGLDAVEVELVRRQLARRALLGTLLAIPR